MHTFIKVIALASKKNPYSHSLNFFSFFFFRSLSEVIRLRLFAFLFNSVIFGIFRRSFRRLLLIERKDGEVQKFRVEIIKEKSMDMAENYKKLYLSKGHDEGQRGRGFEAYRGGILCERSLLSIYVYEYIYIRAYKYA